MRGNPNWYCIEKLYTCPLPPPAVKVHDKVNEWLCYNASPNNIPLVYSKVLRMIAESIYYDEFLYGMENEDGNRVS